MDQNIKKTTRKSAIKSMFSGVLAAGAGLFGISQAKAASGEETSKPIKTIADKNQQGEAPLFSSVKVHDGLVYVAGKGEHGEGDITVHTNSVLDQIEEALEEAGSSMEKVLKVNVYLHDIRDYDGLNAPTVDVLVTVLLFAQPFPAMEEYLEICLLYTSDAADE